MQTDDILKSVVVISERVDIRGAVREAIKEIGATHVTSLGTIQEAYDFFTSASQHIGWIFCTLDVESEYNWLQLLSAKLSNETLAQTLVTVLISEENKQYIPITYELGVTNHFTMPFTHNDLIRGLNNLIDSGEKCGWNTAELASKNLREYLNESENYNELLRLERALVNRFPNKPIYLVHLAEALYSSGDIPEARKILRRATMLDGEASKAAKQLQDLISNLDNEEVQESKSNFQEAYDIKSAMIIDSDLASIKLIKDALMGLGVENFLEFEDGESAMQALTSTELPEVIVTEWIMPKLGGLQLVQRINNECKKMPVIVIASSRIRKSDEVLLKEMPIAGHIDKPIQKQELQTLVIGSIISRETPQDANKVYQNLHLAIRNEDKEEAEKLYISYKSFKNRDEVTDLLVEAEMSYLKGFYEEAKQHAYNAFIKSGGSLAANALMVKILLALKQPIDAIKALNWAQSMSPHNLLRVCQLAELSSEIGDTESASKWIEQAESIDKDAELTKETTARVALNTGEVDKIKDLFGQMGSLAPLITYMNNRAVMLVRNGEIDKGLKLYSDALSSLPDERRKERSAILYNTGLAFARLNRLEEASEKLAEIRPEDHPRLHDKALSLKRNVDLAVKKNQTLKFSQKEETMETSHSLHIPMAFEMTPGRFGLHLIYTTGKIETPEIQRFFKNFRRIHAPLSQKHSS